MVYDGEPKGDEEHEWYRTEGQQKGVRNMGGIRRRAKKGVRNIGGIGFR